MAVQSGHVHTAEFLQMLQVSNILYHILLFYVLLAASEEICFTMYGTESS